MSEATSPSTERNVEAGSSAVTRRRLLKAGGAAALGLAFAAPVISSIRPRRAFGAYQKMCLYRITDYTDEEEGDICAVAGMITGAIICLPCVPSVTLNGKCRIPVGNCTGIINPEPGVVADICTITVVRVSEDCMECPEDGITDNVGCPFD